MGGGASYKYATKECGHTAVRAVYYVAPPVSKIDQNRPKRRRASVKEIWFKIEIKPQVRTLQFRASGSAADKVLV